MSLDLGETIVQLDRLSDTLGRGHGDRLERLEQLRAAAAGVSPQEAKQRTQEPGIPFLAAQVTDTLLGEVMPPPPPGDWPAVSPCTTATLSTVSWLPRRWPKISSLSPLMPTSAGSTWAFCLPGTDQLLIHQTTGGHSPHAG